MTKFVTPKYQPAERIYPTMPMRFAQIERAAGSGQNRERRRGHTENRLIFPIRSTL
ncbi:hypothetical protein [Bradyrhizobium sp. YR681]|uniref:hypothetical protein n=1 Tax=Bradyrhizobium sp. YR681 TaxID=1144344 RepID=UPI000318D965|nr:hypothetical protein [Bradyrhizobium sp. YR681]